MHDTDVRLKVRVILESATGERIAEVDNEHMFRGCFDEPSLRTAEATLARALDATVLSPARALVRAHVNRLLERVSFRRRMTTPPVIVGMDDAGVKAALNDKLMAIMTQQK